MARALDRSFDILPSMRHHAAMRSRLTCMMAALCAACAGPQVTAVSAQQLVQRADANMFDALAEYRGKRCSSAAKCCKPA
jgi:hypothetical protein